MTIYVINIFKWIDIVTDDYNGVRLNSEYANNEDFVNASYIHVSITIFNKLWIFLFVVNNYKLLQLLTF